MKPIAQYLIFPREIPIFFVLTALAILTVFSSCSQHKNTLLSKGFHNTTARYNAYFLAKERMKEVEQKILKAHTDDYNRILLIFPIVSESAESAIKSDLEYIIEKGALPVNKHKNSKWVDDSYNIIGKARLYQKEYKLATQTFKYVNTKSDDNKARHAAMILLLRTYLDSLQIENARATNDYLKKEKITEENAADLYLTRASFYQVQEDYEQMKENLEKALTFMRKGEDKARVYFIIGQIYQKQGNDQKAHENYSMVFKNNPPYELFFYARLYIAQVSSLAQSDKRKIDKYFKKLLKDEKNVEYRDKIFYEMGKYELKQNNIPKSIENFETSIRENKGNQFQKARSYLALGNLYYDKLQKFELSKLYFDSTVTLWDEKDKEYEWIANRQEILTEFVEYYQTYKREDSLLTLSKMDSASIVRKIDNIIEEEARIERERARQEALAEKKRKQEEEFRKQQEQVQVPQPGIARRGNKSWYFYDPASIKKGKSEFTKTWGNRKLEDNWRRSEKQTFADYEEKEEFVVEDQQQEDNTQDSLLAVQAQREEMFKNVPSTQAELDSAHAHLENALYNLGKIYDQKLLEPKNAVSSFKELLERYPDSELKAEIYYFLYLTLKNLNDEEYIVYKDKLFQEFPNSSYSKIINNPNYLAENKINNLEAGKIYRQAFDLHKEGLYITSDSVLSTITPLYPDNNIKDKIAFLGVQNKGKTQSPVVYKQHLEEFIRDYPNSNIVPEATRLISRSVDYIEKRKKIGFNVEDQTRFMKNFERPHAFMVLIENNGAIAGRAIADISRYNKTRKLEVSTPVQESLSDTITAILVEGFRSKDEANKYKEALVDRNKVLAKYGKYVTTYIISNDNFVILQRSGNVSGYKEFFKRNYNEKLIYGD